MFKSPIHYGNKNVNRMVDMAIKDRGVPKRVTASIVETRGKIAQRPPRIKPFTRGEPPRGTHPFQQSTPEWGNGAIASWVAGHTGVFMTMKSYRTSREHFCLRTI